MDGSMAWIFTGIQYGLSVRMGVNQQLEAALSGAGLDALHHRGKEGRAGTS